MSSSPVAVVAAVTVTTLAWASPPASAQIAPRAAAVRQAAQAAPPPTAGWQDRFFVQSPDGDYRLQLGLTAQIDGRFFVADESPGAPVNTFVVRKARPILSGRVARHFEFKFMPDFGNGAAVLADVYVDLRLSPALRVRAGKDKTPIGLELLQGDPYIWFPERSLVSSLVPNRDLGFQVQGDLANGRVRYAGGVFNGVPDNASSTSDLDANAGKDLAGRLVIQPLKGSGASRLSGLGFAVGASAGRQSGPLPTFKTSGGRTYFSYDDDARAEGVRTRVSPSVFYYRGSFGGFAEYVRSAQSVARAGSRGDIANDAWNVTVSWLPTGETATDGAVRPASPFSPPDGRWGALQLLFRATSLSIDRQAFLAGFAEGASSRMATAVAIGASWHLTAFVKYYATFERTTFNGAAPRPAEHVMVFRAQLAF